MLNDDYCNIRCGYRRGALGQSANRENMRPIGGCEMKTDRLYPHHPLYFWFIFILKEDNSKMEKTLAVFSDTIGLCVMSLTGGYVWKALQLKARKNKRSQQSYIIRYRKPWFLPKKLINTAESIAFQVTNTSLIQL